MSCNEDRNYLEIDKSVIRFNLSTLRGLMPKGCRILSMLKGNGYGHGVVSCLDAYDEQTDYYGVASYSEASAIRETGNLKPILIFGWVPSSLVPQCARRNFLLNVFSIEYARYINEALKGTGQKVKVHIEFDTGIGRAGIRCFDDSDIPLATAYAREIFGMDNLLVEGGFTHFSCIDSVKPEDAVYAENQHAMFVKLYSHLEEMGYHFKIKHCSSSTAILRHPEWDYDMVRAGKVIYGIGLFDDDKAKYGFKPAMTWRARIIELKDIKSGEYIGYGRTFCAKENLRLAVLAVGYGDGYHRNYSNKTSVGINGTICPVIGAISMDFMAIDVTRAKDVRLGDTAVILGEADGVYIPTSIFAKLGGANSEVTACITSRVPRYYLN